MALNITETPIVNALTVLADDGVLSKSEHIYDPNYGSASTPDSSKYQDQINLEVWSTPKTVVLSTITTSIH